MIEYKDCPECVARKIHSTVRLCEVCETWERAEKALDAQDAVLTARYNEQLVRAERAEKERDLYKTQLAHVEADAEQAVHAAQYDSANTVSAALDERNAARSERDALVNTLVDLFGWSDRSYLHAVVHVENAVKNLKTSLVMARHLLDDARDTLLGQHDPEDNLAMIRKIDAELEKFDGRFDD